MFTLLIFQTCQWPAEGYPHFRMTLLSNSSMLLFSSALYSCFQSSFKLHLLFLHCKQNEGGGGGGGLCFIFFFPQTDAKLNFGELTKQQTALNPWDSLRTRPTQLPPPLQSGPESPLYTITWVCSLEVTFLFVLLQGLSKKAGETQPFFMLNT